MIDISEMVFSSSINVLDSGECIVKFQAWIIIVKYFSIRLVVIIKTPQFLSHIRLIKLFKIVATNTGYDSKENRKAVKIVGAEPIIARYTEE